MTLTEMIPAALLALWRSSTEDRDLVLGPTEEQNDGRSTG